MATIFACWVALSLPATVQHDDARLGAQVGALEAAIAALPGPTWRHLDYTPIGNFFEAKWCRGAGARDDCQIASGSADQRDQHAVALYVLHYDLPKVFGLGFNALRVPVTAGIGTSVDLAVGGHRIVGAGSGVTFRRYDAPTGPPAFVLSLGSSLSWTLHETTVRVAAEGGPEATLRRLLASPESLKIEGLHELDALAAEVTRTLDAGTAEACDYQPYKGDGIPPVCVRRPLKPAEVAEARAAAATHFAEGRRWLSTETAALYEALAATAPVAVFSK